MFLLLGCCFFVMFTVGCLLLHIPEEVPQTSDALDVKITDAGGELADWRHRGSLLFNCRSANMRDLPAYEQVPGSDDDEEVTAYVAPSEEDDSVGSPATLLDKGQKRQFHPKELLMYPTFY